MRKFDLLFLAFFAFYTAVSLLLLLVGLGPMLASSFPGVQETFEAWGKSGVPLAPVWDGISQASPLSKGIGRVVADYLFSALNIGFGVFILWRRPYERVARVLALALVGTGTVFNFQAHGVLLTTGTVLAGLHLGLHAVSGATYVHALLIFPNGKLVPRRSEWLVAVVYFLMIAAILFVAASSGFGAAESDEPIGDLDFIFTAEAVMFILFFGLLIPLVGVTSQVYRYNTTSTAHERQQTKLFVWATSVAFVAGVLYLVIAVALNASRWGGLSAEALEDLEHVVFLNFPVLFAIVPLALVVAVMRYRLWDIDLLINRTLVYGILTAILAGTYFAIVVLLQMAFRAATGQESAVAVVASTLVIAALFLPLRRRTQDFIDRRFNRRRYDAARTLAAFSARMRDEVDLGRLSGALVSVVEETMQPAHVSLWLREGERKREEESVKLET